MMRRFVPTVAMVCVLMASSFSSRAHAQELSEQDQDLVEAYDVMQAVTAGLLGGTAVLGLTQLYNLPTSFGEGACARDSAIFGHYACVGGHDMGRPLSLLHAGLGIATLVSYGATATLALAAPDRDVGQEDTVTDVLGVVHGVGIGLTSLLGIVGANPSLIGIRGESAQAEFSRHMRVVHWLVAMVTASAFGAHLLVDHIE